MRAQVPDQGGPLAEANGAQRAGQGPLQGVRARMLGQGDPVAEALGACRTHMHAFVLEEVRALAEALPIAGAAIKTGLPGHLNYCPQESGVCSWRVSPGCDPPKARPELRQG